MPGDDQMKSALGLVAVPMVLALALLTSGCNTVQGMGKDVQAAGSAMTGASEDTEEMIEDKMDEDTEQMHQSEDKMMDEGTAGDQSQ